MFQRLLFYVSGCAVCVQSNELQHSLLPCLSLVATAALRHDSALVNNNDTASPQSDQGAINHHRLVRCQLCMLQHGIAGDNQSVCPPIHTCATQATAWPHPSATPADNSTPLAQHTSAPHVLVSVAYCSRKFGPKLKLPVTRIFQ
jgi:hypothetical protein